MSNLPETTTADCIPPEVSTIRTPSNPRIFSDEDALPPCRLPGEIYAQESSFREDGYVQNVSLVYPQNQGVDDEIWRSCRAIAGRATDQLNQLVQGVSDWERENVGMSVMAQRFTSGDPSPGSPSPSRSSSTNVREYTMIEEQLDQVKLGGQLN